jgi:hypothetical protein
MNCVWENHDTPDANGNRRVRCTVCGYVTRTSTAWPFSKIYRSCDGQSPKEISDPATTYGPGTELKQLLHDELGIQPTASCGCDAMVAKMNAWGVEGCRANREEILAHLQSAYDSASTLTAIRAGLNSLRGYPKTLAGLLDLAIARADLANRPV